MKDDFLEELGFLAISSRLKRVSDRMIHSGREMYKQLQLDIEPNWYMILLLLKKSGPMAVTEVAKRLGLSHPSVIAIINKMKAAGYLIGTSNEKDRRSQLLELTGKASKELPRLEAIWQAGTRSNQKLCEGLEVLDMLEKLESRLAEQDFKTRTLNEYQEQTS